MNRYSRENPICIIDEIITFLSISIECLHSISLDANRLVLSSMITRENIYLLVLLSSTLSEFSLSSQLSIEHLLIDVVRRIKKKISTIITRHRRIFYHVKHFMFFLYPSSFFKRASSSCKLRMSSRDLKTLLPPLSDYR